MLRRVIGNCVILSNRSRDEKTLPTISRGEITLLARRSLPLSWIVPGNWCTMRVVEMLDWVLAVCFRNVCLSTMGRSRDSDSQYGLQKSERNRGWQFAWVGTFWCVLSVVWIAEIDHVLEACGRGGVSVKTHEICIHNIPVSRLFLSQCLLLCCLQL